MTDSDDTWQYQAMSRYILIILVLLMAGFGFVRYLERSMLFHPHPDFTATPKQFHLDHEELSLKTRDGSNIHGWFFPADTAKATIIISHGNGENVGDTLAIAAFFHRQGFAVITYDYHGYGKSEGTPSEETLVSDIDAVYNYLIESKELAPETIVLFGYSLGGGPSVDLAARKKVGLVVLQSTFCSIEEVGRDIFGMFPIYKLVRNKFDNLAKINRLTVPVIFGHGKRDRTVHFSHSLRLHERFQGKKELILVDDADHGNLFDRIAPRYIRFIRENLALTSSGPQR